MDINSSRGTLHATRSFGSAPAKPSEGAKRLNVFEEPDRPAHSLGVLDSEDQLMCKVEQQSLGHLQSVFKHAVKRMCQLSGLRPQEVRCSEKEPYLPQVATVRALVRQGVLRNMKFELGYGQCGNCVDWAVVNGYSAQAVEILEIADEVDLGSHFAEGAKAAFFWSVIQGYTDTLEALLKRGADVAQTHNVWSSGDSALDLAIFGSRPAEVEVLLRYGAWKQTSEAQRQQLLRWSHHRPFILDVLKRGGIGKA